MQALLLFTALFLPRRVEDALAARLVGPWGSETAARRDLAGGAPDRGSRVGRTGAGRADDPEIECVIVAGRIERDDIRLDHAHLARRPGGLGPGNTIAGDGLRAGQAAGAERRRALPGQLELAQSLVLPRGTDTVAPGEGVRADILGAA